MVLQIFSGIVPSKVVVRERLEKHSEINEALILSIDIERSIKFRAFEKFKAKSLTSEVYNLII